MNDSARYVKIVEWSDEDRCYVGSAPGLLYGGCHGDDERAVSDGLSQIVEETTRSTSAKGVRCRLRPRGGTMPTRCSAWPDQLMQRALDPAVRPMPQAPVCGRRRSSRS